MTREQIEEWMRLSGADFPHMASLNRDLFPAFARFAEYAAKHEADRIADESKHIIKRAEKRGAEIEREACAKVCEEKSMIKGGEVFAARIRARGEK